MAETEPEWSAELVHRGDGRVYLECDDCPVCGEPPILNVGVHVGGQMLAVPSAHGEDIPDEALVFDDGPWFESLEYARCGRCDTVLLGGSPE